ncbi:hypothetical protein IGK74_002472 [Enterococcus sp. AZ150]|uniref:hypothetical protein n=1 Tax=Enterococcus sp. AZ150 TaxID=2774866 RepID=UPI003F212E5B
MEEKQLQEYMELTLGTNLAKAKEELEDYQSLYDQAAFQFDLTHFTQDIRLNTSETSQDKSLVQTGDLVISNALKLAAIVSPENSGKLLTNNFIRVSLITDCDHPLNKYYFLYLFNESNHLAKQKNQELQLQGNTVVKRIPISAYNAMNLPIVSTEEQQRIGKIYIETKKVKQHLQDYAETIEDFSFSMIEQHIKDGGTK